MEYILSQCKLWDVSEVKKRGTNRFDTLNFVCERDSIFSISKPRKKTAVYPAALQMVDASEYRIIS